MVATSGSTGAPKGVVHTHVSVAASARASSARLSVDPGRDRWLGCLPLAHIGGLSVVTRALLTGTPLELHPRFDAAAVDDAARRGATLVSVVPTALARIDPAAFRKLVVGGAAPPAQLPPNVVTSYGSTETGSACAYDGVAARRRGAARSAPTARSRFAATCCCGATATAPTPGPADGWFPTGDHGQLDGDGRLRVDGRLDDLIITGGENVWPQAVEQVLAAAPSVAEVAVVGRPDPEWGQQVVALVVPTPAEPSPTLEGCATWSRRSCRPTPRPGSSSWSTPCPAPCWARSSAIVCDRADGPRSSRLRPQPHRASAPRWPRHQVTARPAARQVGRLAQAGADRRSSSAT